LQFLNLQRLQAKATISNPLMTFFFFASTPICYTEQKARWRNDRNNVLHLLLEIDSFLFLITLLPKVVFKFHCSCKAKKWRVVYNLRTMAKEVTRRRCLLKQRDRRFTWTVVGAIKEVRRYQTLKWKWKKWGGGGWQKGIVRICGGRIFSCDWRWLQS